jgi:alkylated DNA nucleotide flippase Atl1
MDMKNRYRVFSGISEGMREIGRVRHVAKQSRYTPWWR